MVALLALYVVWLLVESHLGSPALPPFVLVLSARILTALAGVFVAGRLWTSRLRRAWVFLAAGLLLWAVAEGARMLLWFIPGLSAGIPSLSDFLRTAGAAAVAVGLALVPSRVDERFGNLRSSLDLTMLAVGIVALTWLVLVRQAMAIGLAKGFEVIWAGVGAALDLTLVAFSTRLVLADLGERGARVVQFLMAGFVLAAVADIAYGYTMLTHDWQPGTWVEALWLGECLLVVSAAFGQLEEQANTPEQLPQVDSRRRQRLARRLETLLPIAVTYVVSGYVIFDYWLSGRLDWLGVLASMSLVLLMLVRQGVVAGQMEMRQFAALVNASTDMAFVCQLDGSLVMCNPAFRRKMGMAASLAGVNLGELIEVEDSWPSVLQGAATHGWLGEVEFLGENGGRRLPVSLSLQPITDERQSEPVLVGTGYDLSDVKAREHQLEHALAEVGRARSELADLNVELERKVEARTRELKDMVADLENLNTELKELDRLKSEFVTLVSHELRTPLTNIRAGVELVLDSGRDLSSQASGTLALVKEETGRLTHFVETILDLSALEAGRFPIHLAPMPVESVAKAVISRFPEGRGRERIRLNLPSDLPPVEADEQSLMSVLFHLLDNAIKYAPEGPIEIGGCELEGGRVQVWVDDQGPGIPMDSRSAVFDQFSRLDTSDAREVYGHGLGLHLSHRLVEAMRGGMQVAESPTGGARLIFWLPASGYPPAERASEESAARG